MDIIKSTGYFCTECKSLCEMYDQGLSCSCDNPWKTEVINEEDYPEKWVKCNIEISLEN